MDAIREALRHLDLENDNHWTADGQPRLDTVKMLAGDQSLTRETVSNAAPGFTRATAASYQGREKDDIDPNEDTGEADLTDAGSKPAGPSVGQQNDLQRGASTESQLLLASGPSNADPLSQLIEESEIEALETSLVSLRKELVMVQKEQEENKKFLAELVEAENTLISRLDKLRPPETNSDAIQSYLARQKEMLAERNEKRSMLMESGVEVRELMRISTDLGPSPLDKAMSNKTNRGSQRPRV